jgi:1-deoxy-D-xylulose 5-phosphate reductoisomerase
MILFIFSILTTLSQYGEIQYAVLPVAIVAAIISTAGATTVGGVDIFTKRKLEKNLAKMSAADAQALQNQLAKTKDAQTKLILLQDAADKAQKRSTTNIIIGSVIGLIGLISAIIVFKKKK